MTTDSTATDQPTTASGPSGLVDAETPPTMITLDQVTKYYPGTEAPAVGEFSLDIPVGEILVFVGPSGCGKSTLLRLINRMIEPTSGRIIFDGDDVTDVNPDELRRRIGYVIQQIGLFPHQTITDNIATVPRMLGWSRSDINERVDELLDLVGMDPEIYRSRYPKELSGGQAQRVGVARALGADPPVMLMDEPFGAIDPITRERLQNEFLRVQEELQKTIVFVTHDIDEAIKMGDRIVILRDQSQIAQFDTPERILAFPVDDFVQDFIGSGATLKGLNLARVRDVEEAADYPTARVGQDVDEVRVMWEQSRAPWVLLLDDRDRPIRWLDDRALHRTDLPLEEVGLEVVAKVERQATLRDALEEMLTGNSGCAVIVDGEGRFEGVIEIGTLTDVINSMQETARRHYEDLAQHRQAGG